MPVERDEQPRVARKRCDACLTDMPASTVEDRVVQGHAVTMCVFPLSCRARAEAAGEWKTYTPAAAR